MKKFLLFLAVFCAGYLTHEAADYYTVYRARMHECEQTQGAEYCGAHWWEP